MSENLPLLRFLVSDYQVPLYLIHFAIQSYSYLSSDLENVNL